MIALGYALAVALVLASLIELYRIKNSTKDLKEMSQATDRLTAAATALNTAADALIARLPNPTVDDAAVQAAAQTIETVTAKLNAAQLPTA